ncbi:MAG: hypothetical protein HPZ91_08585 [Lentisphaeria bacterium]|nr:hypothetical protein [Lentisphaeria bacterium]
MSVYYDMMQGTSGMNIIDQLESLGLNGRQAKVYLALLQLGSASAIEIAKTTRFKHPTVYDVLDVLKERRLVSETFEGGRKLFSAENPNQLRLAEEERRRTLEDLLPDLQALYSGGSCRPRVRVYLGPEGMEAVDDELLSVRSGEYFYFGGVREMIQNSSEEHLSDYYRKRLSRGIWSNAIRIRGREDDLEYMQNGDQHLRRVRYLPKPIFENTAGLYLYDDRVAVISALKENYAMIIESGELSLLLKTIWNCMWEIAVEP